MRRLVMMGQTRFYANRRPPFVSRRIPDELRTLAAEENILAVALASGEKKAGGAVGVPPARRRDSKGGGGETPQMNTTTTYVAMQQSFVKRSQKSEYFPSDFLILAIT
jgi:hypothetical protein